MWWCLLAERSRWAWLALGACGHIVVVTVGVVTGAPMVALCAPGPIEGCAAWGSPLFDLGGVGGSSVNEWGRRSFKLWSAGVNWVWVAVVCLMWCLLVGWR